MITKKVTIKRKCIICGCRFELNRQEQSLINQGLIGPKDVNICEECATAAAEQWAEEDAIRELRDIKAN